MEPGAVLFSLLCQAPDVVALVGTRIYPLRVPQGQARPNLTYQLISNTPGGLAACAHNQRARVQVSVFADTYEQVCQLSQAVRAALDGHTDGPLTIDFSNQTDQFDNAAACFFRSQDYLLDYPAVP